MPLHKKRGPVHEINVVPYVDVMLVLLVIFMVTAPLVTPAVIDLPTVDKASAPRLVPLEVFVKSDQGIFVRQRDARGGVVNEQSLSRAQLPGFIKSLKSKGELSVVIGGDKNARYESVLHVMDELRKNGVQKVGLQVKTTQ
jgi:biopolymer transport protein TolR